MRIVHGLFFASVLAGSLVGAGCGGATSATGESQDALDTSDVNHAEAAVLTSGADVSFSGTVAGDIATSVAAGWAGKFTPAGCATSTASGSTVTLTLNGCTGPFGLVSATGTLDLDVSVVGGAFTGHATSTGMKLNRATVDIDATFTFTNNGGTKMLSVTASGDAVGPRGRHLTRSGSYTVTWGSGCLSLDGNWTTTVAAIEYTTTITSFSVCQGDCPAAGGSIAWVGPKRTLTITFDGSADASFVETGPLGGAHGDVVLSCQPAS